MEGGSADEIGVWGAGMSRYAGERMQDAYLEAVVFTECGDEGQPPEDAEFSAIAKMEAYIECRNLLWANKDIINDSNCEQAAHDLWLTRNHHGAGFWDRPSEVYGGEANRDILDRCARSMGDRDLIQGDDDLLYFSP